MHMWMWFGYDLGEFMFPGLNIDTRWSFALTWIVLFFVALMFEASKVFLAKLQKDAHKKLYPFRSDERRNLLCERFMAGNAHVVPLVLQASIGFGNCLRWDQAGNMEPTTSRNTSSGQVSRWSTLRVRALVNTHQTLMFVVHNVVGYLLMLAVMVYNVHLLLAVVFGMMLGYFLFGTKLTRLQMQCFSTKRNVICTPECDDTAETSTPPLLNSAPSSESDFFECRTRTCIQPSHYFPAADQGESSAATCYYGAKQCPSKVARAKKVQEATCHYTESEKEDSPSVEDVQLLRTERQGCCKKKQEPPPECCKSSQEVVQDPQSCCKEEPPRQETREDSPQISCCHNAKTPTDSQEQIIQ